jgi:hypothetical protein
MPEHVLLRGRSDIIAAWEAFRILFRSGLSCDQPLRIPGSGAILADVRLEMTEEQYAVVAKAAVAAGDTLTYVSFLGTYEGTAQEEMPDDFEMGPHFRTTLDEDPLRQIGDEAPPMSEYVMYSPRGIWGVMVSLEWHAIITGPADFRLRVTSAPVFSDSVRQFLGQWRTSRDRYSGRTSWVPELIENVYGIERARQILAEFGEPRERWTRDR